MSKPITNNKTAPSWLRREGAVLCSTLLTVGIYYKGMPTILSGMGIFLGHFA